MWAWGRSYGDQGKTVDASRGACGAQTMRTRRRAEQFPVLKEWYSPWPVPHLSGGLALRELWYSITKNVRNPKEIVARRVLGSLIWK